MSRQNFRFPSEGTVRSIRRTGMVAFLTPMLSLSRPKLVSNWKSDVFFKGCHTTATLWIRNVLMRIRIQLKILMRIRIQIRGEGVGQPKMCIPPGKILGTPLASVVQWIEKSP